MKLYRDLSGIQVAADGRAVAVGMFDGVHAGHRALLGILVAGARERGLRSCVLTFENHPLQLLRPSDAPKLITHWRRKAAILGGLGIDDVVMAPFDETLAATSAEEFVTCILARDLSAKLVVCGPNFRYGRGAQGTPETLNRVGEPLGIRTEIVELVGDRGVMASSTGIRTMLLDGDVIGAGRMLGEPFVLMGEVRSGSHRGTGLGFPTANVTPFPDLLIAGDGVYACRAECARGQWFAAVSIGTRPTFSEAESVVEAHLIDYPGDSLYGEQMSLTFAQRLRDQTRFESAEDLVRQMENDIMAVRAALNACAPGGIG